MATTRTRTNAKERVVVVRTYSAGVYVGTLRDKSADGRRVVLTDARLVYSWQGALTTLDLAAVGPSAAKMSHPCDEVEVTEAIAIIVMSAEAAKRFDGIVPWKS